MDTPGIPHLEASSASNDDPAMLPELSRSQTTLDGPPSPGLQKRKSQRTRPTEVLEKQHAAPPAPLKTPARQPEVVRPRPSKMSLFSLFSRPKVEKLRGYAEQGLDAPADPPRALSTGEAIGAKQSVAVRVENLDAERGQARPTTSRSYSARAARFMSKETPPPVTPSIPSIPVDRKPRAFDPPPLFQVWPQTIKHGTFEMPSTTSETVLQKPKSRTNAVLFMPGGETPSLNVPGNRGSIESRMTVKTSVRHMRSSSNLMSLPKKLFVLTTSGYLLQYAENGLNERLPEKILRLGKYSAAYASDLLPGKHHVLQVAHAVDPHGVIVGDSQSIFSRFGMRGQPKKVSSSFLLVMPNAEEMAAWMRAIRKEIEIQGGRRTRSDSNTRPKSGKPVLDLKKNPSVSHRYQIKRDPNGPSNVGSPTSEAFPTPSAVERDEHEIPQMKKEATPPPVSEDESRSREDTPMNRPRAPSDTPSIGSSAAMSVDQQQLDKLRNSARMSRTSTVATSVTAASRTNSMASSPSDQSNESYDAVKDTVHPMSSYRSLSSFTLAKRRSATPLCLKDPPRPDTGTFLSLQHSHMQEMINSPVVGHHSPIPEPRPLSKSNRLSTAQSAPNLKSIAEPASSSLPFPLSTPEERPESFLADLPDPTTWANKHSPGHRSSVVPFPPLLETQATDFHQPNVKASNTRPPVTSRPLRSSSNSFSLPLRVNPIEPTSSKSSKVPKSPDVPVRPSSGEQEERVSSPVAAVTTLEAKVNIVKRTTIDASHIPPRKSSTGSPPCKRRGSKLSLFPAAKPIAPPPPFFAQTNMRTRSPSATAMTTFAPSSIPPNSTRLARPASLQVRSDHAPFLSSIRRAETEGPPRSVTTIPIRSLKPSRSASNIVTRAAAPPEQFNFFNNPKPTVDGEASDHITPLVDSLHSPLVLGSMARKGPRVRASMPEMDITALGPPAPPPSAPLPATPSLAQQTRLSIIRAGTPIGVAIGEALHEVRGVSPTKMGLGIQVGRNS